jgi:hypothetical protein
MKTMERTYTDLTSLDAYPSTAVYPTQVSLTRGRGGGYWAGIWKEDERYKENA